MTTETKKALKAALKREAKRYQNDGQGPIEDGDLELLKAYAVWECGQCEKSAGRVYLIFDPEYQSYYHLTDSTLHMVSAKRMMGIRSGEQKWIATYGKEIL